jgi:hypothetical protein
MYRQENCITISEKEQTNLKKKEKKVYQYL